MSAEAPVPAGPELSIVVPVYNEGAAVEPVLRALTAAVRTPHEILVIYDFDGDTTVPVIARLAAELPTIEGLRNDLGRGVLNAMKAGIGASSGAYVLVSMADGSDEPSVVDPMIEHGKTGLLVPPRDPEALAAALVLVLADPEYAAALGKAGHDLVNERFCLEFMVRAVESIYDEAVADERSLAVG